MSFVCICSTGVEGGLFLTPGSLISELSLSRALVCVYVYAPVVCPHQD